MRRFQAFIAASILTVIASPAAAQLVTNGSFETGDLSGWTVNASATFASTGGFDGYGPEDGSSFAALGNVGGIGTLSQLISTTSGTAYTLDYYLATNGSTPSYFSASWDGQEIGGSIVNNPGVQPYTLYQFIVTGSGSDTLTFNERDDPAYLALDNISLNPAAVPEPATWAMMLLGFGAIGFALRRRRQLGALQQLA